MQAGFQITLDGKPLKSPARQKFILPTRSLALAIAAEWEWQVSLPIQRLASTILIIDEKTLGILTHWQSSPFLIVVVTPSHIMKGMLPCPGFQACETLYNAHDDIGLHSY